MLENMPVPEKHRISSDVIALLQVSDCQTRYTADCWWVFKNTGWRGREWRVYFCYQTNSFSYESFARAIQCALSDQTSDECSR